MKRLRANERKNVKKYLRPAVGVARKSAEEHGFEVQIERTNGATGWKQLFRWTEAVIRLGPVDISVRFELADKQSPASLSTIRIYAAHTLLRTCPADLLQSGDEQAFETWLSRHLEKAVKRSRGRG